LNQLSIKIQTFPDSNNSSRSTIRGTEIQFVQGSCT
jgi:hypothetical protein